MTISIHQKHLQQFLTLSEVKMQEEKQANVSTTYFKELNQMFDIMTFADNMEIEEIIRNLLRNATNIDRKNNSIKLTRFAPGLQKWGLRFTIPKMVSSGVE